jgi:membrane-associated phospholipid phosphatase
MKKRWIALIVFFLSALFTFVSYFNWDIPLAYYSRGLSNSVLNIAQIITVLGESRWYYILFIPAYFLLRFAWKNKLWSMRILFLFTAISASGIFNMLIKWIAGRHRPINLINNGLFGFNYFEVIYELTSFPSGHSVTVFTLAAAISFLSPRWSIVAFILALLIAMSRVLITSHYLGDVIGGAGIGILCALAVKYFFDRNKIQLSRAKESRV